MRNTLLGAALAVVLVAALFAASHYGRKPAQGPAEPAVPQAAGALKNDFIGQVKFGAWKLACNKARELPRPPSAGMQGNSESNTPKEPPPPPGWKLPRCITGLVLHNPRNKTDEIRVTFRHVSFRRVLTMFLRFPPGDVTTGDIVKARFGDTGWNIPVRTCSAQFCLAIESIKLADTAVVENAKSFSLAFTPDGQDTEIVLPIPVDGLTDALHAMRRLND